MSPSPRRYSVTTLATALAVAALVASSVIVYALTGGVAVTGTVPLDAANGPQINATANSNSELLLENPYPDSNTVEVTVDNGTVGFESSSPGATADIHESNITTQWVNVTNLGVSSTSLAIDPDNKERVTVSGDTETLALADMAVDNGNADFVYGGANGGTTTITIHSLTNAAPGDSVAAVDNSGSTLDRTTVASDGSITFSLSQSTHTVTLQSAPGTMEVYNESAPETLIDDREITAEFFDLNGDSINEQTTTNGKLDLSGLEDSAFAVRLSANGYADRQVIIKDINRQQNAWLLNATNNNISRVQPTFTIDDETGNFDPTTSRVYIQRGLNISNETMYRTIAAEEVGTDGYTETIVADQRYRIIVENTKGDRRVLGKFSASDSNTYALTVEELIFNLEKDEEAVNWGFNHTEVENGQDTVNFRYQDLAERTENLEVVIYERGNESNELHNATYNGPLGNLSITETVPSGDENAEWVVEWNADRGDDSVNAKISAGPLGSVPLPTSDRLVHTMAVGFILIVGGLASQVNAPAVGFAVAGTAGIAYYIGWLPTAVAGGMIVLAFFVPLLYLVQSEGGFG